MVEQPYPQKEGGAQQTGVPTAEDKRKLKESHDRFLLELKKK